MAMLNMILAQVGAVADSSAVQTAADTLRAAATSMTQAADTVAQVAAPAAPTVVKDLSVWNLTMAGGWLMIPLALLAIVSIYIFFERVFAINRASKEDGVFMERIKNHIHNGEVSQALQLCKDTNTPSARMIEKGVTRIGRPMNDVLVAIENVGNMEVAKLEKGFSWLATTAAGAPMIGFLHSSNSPAQEQTATSPSWPAASTRLSSPPWAVSSWASSHCLPTTTSPRA